MNYLKSFLEENLGRKAPALPVQVKTFLVAVAPWLIVISILVTLPTILVLIGINSVIPSYYQSMGMANNATASIIVAVALVLNMLALPGLFKKTIAGWNWVYYSVLVQTLANLVSFNLISGFIGLIISMYILFQVKSYYH